jgi:hypothetical protein
MFNQSAFTIGDYLAAIVATLTALFLYAEISKTCKWTHTLWKAFIIKHDAHEFLPMITLRQSALWMMAIGWTLISIRIWMALIEFGDAPIAPISVVALLLVGCGTIVLQLIRRQT